MGRPQQWREGGQSTSSEGSFPSWNAEEAFPAFIPALDPASNDIMGKDLPDLYVGVAEHNPAQIMSQYNTYADETQVFYYEAMGADSSGDWTGLMLDSVAEIAERAPNFCSFTAPGDMHCIVTRNDFYTAQSDGVLLVDWLGEMLSGSQPESVMCQDCAPG